jgi:hypothetical protein
MRPFTHLGFALLAATPLPAQSGGTVTVGTAAELIDAVFALNNFDGPRTILLRDGVYTIDNYNSFFLTPPGVTIRGLSGDRDAVVIQGDSVFHADGSRTGGTIGVLFNVAGDNFTIENVTVGNVANHAVQLQLDIDNCVFRNVRFFNTGEQMLKVASNGVADQSDNGLVENCLFEYPAGIGPQWYIGGVDAHRARNWTVRNCVFRNIRSPSGAVAEHAIHFWESCIGSVVENNVIVDCDRGIGFGLGTSAANGTTGGIIRNNMIYHRAVAGFADVGIGLENAAAVQVYNNTIFLQSGYPNAIEYRFAGTSAEIYNNLTNVIIRQRDSATGTLGNNLTTAQTTWFRLPADGDLHLASRVSAVVDQGRAVAGLVADIDGESRPQAAGFDIGADEFTEAPPAVYATWRTANFTGTDLASDTVSGPAADPDGTGLNNFARYAFALAARGPVASPVTLGTADTATGRVLTLTFNRRATASDLSYILESSTDLDTWAPIPGLTYAPGTPTSVTALDSVAIGTIDTARRFLRVRVQAAP